MKGGGNGYARCVGAGPYICPSSKHELTLSPTFHSVTPFPTCTTSPAISLPSTRFSLSVAGVYTAYHGIVTIVERDGMDADEDFVGLRNGDGGGRGAGDGLEAGAGVGEDEGGVGGSSWD